MDSSQHLKSEITALFAATNGDFSLAFRDLSDSNNQIFINEKESFHAASTMKTPVMIELFKQAHEGSFSLSDSLLVKNEFKSIVDGTLFSLDIGRDDGEHIYEQMGQKRSIKDLLLDMIIYSSNLATNILIQLVGAANVNQTVRDYGARDIKVLRGVEDMKAYDAGLNNTTTAYDLMIIFEKLAKGEAVNKEASYEMIEILLQQTHRDIIPAKLPKDVKVANKTGFITGVHHDSGIVFLPDGRKYVLVLLSKNMGDSEAGRKMLAEVSRLIYKSF
jgi:beta-lactamase class A